MNVLNTDHLVKIIDDHIKPRHPKSMAVAFSGGLDSLVLLYACNQWCQLQKVPCRAIHVNHHWSKQSQNWALWCQKKCDQWSIPMSILNIHMSQKNNLEAHARHLRYQALDKNLRQDEWLALGHHADDQAETFLMHAHRKSGWRGMSAMESTPTRFRPFLDTERKDLEAFARSQKWQWIHDPSNDDPSMTRSQIRSKITPVLKQIWPNSSVALARCAQNIRQQHHQMQELISFILPKNRVLDINFLQSFSHDVQILLIREWLQSYDIQPPCNTRIHDFLRQLTASQDRQPSLSILGTIKIQRYLNQLHIINPLNQRTSAQWHCQQNSEYPIALGRLVLRERNNHIDQLDIHYRHTLPDAKIMYPTMTKSIKKCFNEWRIPPWLRDHWPLIVLNNTIISIPNYFHHHAYEDLAPIDLILT